jgi:hypothetical protein
MLVGRGVKGQELPPLSGLDNIILLAPRVSFSPPCKLRLLILMSGLNKNITGLI